MPCSLEITPLSNVRPSILFAKICLWGYIYLQFIIPLSIHGNLIRTEELYDSDEQKEG